MIWPINLIIVGMLLTFGGILIVSCFNLERTDEQQCGR